MSHVQIRHLYQELQLPISHQNNKYFSFPCQLPQPDFSFWEEEN